MPEGDYRNGISLARWQGGVDQKLQSHEERLNSQSGQMKTIGDAIVGMREDLRDLSKDVKTIKELRRGDQQTRQFQWTLLTKLLAGFVGAFTVAIQLYIAAKR